VVAPAAAFFLIWMTGHFSLLITRINKLSSQKHDQFLILRSTMDRHLLCTFTVESATKRYYKYKRQRAEHQWAGRLRAERQRAER